MDKKILQLRELRLIYPINKVGDLGLFLLGFYIISKVNNERSQPNHCREFGLPSARIRRGSRICAIDPFLMFVSIIQTSLSVSLKPKGALQ